MGRDVGGRATTGWTRRRTVGMLGAWAGAVPLIAAAGGCGPETGGGAPGAQPAGGTGKKAITLRWSPWDGEGQAIVDGANKGMALYKQSHPHVSFELIGQTGDFNPKVDAMIAAGDGPDVFGGNGAVWRDRAVQGQFLALDPLIKRDLKPAQIADYVEAHYKAFALPTTGQFSLPMYLGTMGLYYNKGWFRERGVQPPDENWDWNTYRDAGVKLATPDQSVWARADVAASSMYRRFHQNGANMVDPQDDTKAAFSSDKAIAALSFERDTIQKDRSTVIVAGPKQAPATVGLDQYQQINAGKIAMWEGGSFTLTRYMNMLGPEVDWDVAPLPKGPAGRFTLATNDGWSIWSGTKAKDAAWELLKFLQSDEWTDVATRIVGQQSARKSFQQRWLAGIKEANPKMADKNLKPFAEAVEKNYARPIELFRKQVEANTEFVNAYNKSVRDGDEEVATSMKAAAELVNQINKS